MNTTRGTGFATGEANAERGESARIRENGQRRRRRRGQGHAWRRQEWKRERQAEEERAVIDRRKVQGINRMCVPLLLRSYYSRMRREEARKEMERRVRGWREKEGTRLKRRQRCKSLTSERRALW
jgi:hypothetical protein